MESALRGGRGDFGDSSDDLGSGLGPGRAVMQQNSQLRGRLEEERTRVQSLHDTQKAQARIVQKLQAKVRDMVLVLDRTLSGGRRCVLRGGIQMCLRLNIITEVLKTVIVQVLQGAGRERPNITGRSEGTFSYYWEKGRCIQMLLGEGDSPIITGGWMEHPNVTV